MPCLGRDRVGGIMSCGCLILAGLAPGGCRHASASFVTRSQVKTSPGSAVTWPLPRACHHWSFPSRVQLSALHVNRDIIVGEMVPPERNLLVLSICCKIVSAGFLGFFFFLIVFLFFFFPFLISLDFHCSHSLLTETSTPPPGKSKGPCSSSLLLAGPTFDGLTPNLHFREWLGYTFSWLSGRYFFRGPELARRGGGGRGWCWRQNKTKAKAK